MKSKKRKFGILLSAVGVAVLGFQSLASAQTASSEAKKFRIIWHIGTNVEPLADASENDERLELLKSKVDGYYFLVLPGGLLTYWPERPIQCRLNFKHLQLANEKEGGDHRIYLNGTSYGAADQEACQEARYAWLTSELKKTGYTGNISNKVLNDFGDELHQAALRRVIAKLDIKKEQVAGKVIMSEMHLIGTEEFGGSGNFYYDSLKDKIFLNEMDGKVYPPKGYRFLAENDIRLNRAMTYQEHHWQSQNGNLLKVPLEPGGSTEYTNGCNFCLPNNIRMLGMLEDAFQKANLHPPRMSMNIRIWSKRDEENILTLKNKATSPFFAGINIEGSHKKELDRVASTVAGAAFVLKNTDFPVTLLIPGSLTPEKAQTNSEKARDEHLIENLIAYVRLFNEQLSAALHKAPGESAICSRRFSIVIGSYGDPLHMETLPLARRDADGNRLRRAGTVGSQILELNRLRTQLCGQ